MRRAGMDCEGKGFERTGKVAMMTAMVALLAGCEGRIGQTWDRMVEPFGLGSQDAAEIVSGDTMIAPNSGISGSTVGSIATAPGNPTYSVTGSRAADLQQFESVYGPPIDGSSIDSSQYQSVGALPSFDDGAVTSAPLSAPSFAGISSDYGVVAPAIGATIEYDAAPTSILPDDGVILYTPEDSSAAPIMAEPAMTTISPAYDSVSYDAPLIDSGVDPIFSSDAAAPMGVEAAPSQMIDLGSLDQMTAPNALPMIDAAAPATAYESVPALEAAPMIEPVSAIPAAPMYDAAMMIEEAGAMELAAPIEVAQPYQQVEQSYQQVELDSVHSAQPAPMPKPMAFETAQYVAIADAAPAISAPVEPADQYVSVDLPSEVAAAQPLTETFEQAAEIEPVYAEAEPVMMGSVGLNSYGPQLPADYVSTSEASTAGSYVQMSADGPVEMAAPNYGASQTVNAAPSGIEIIEVSELAASETEAVVTEIASGQYVATPITDNSTTYSEMAALEPVTAQTSGSSFATYQPIVGEIIEAELTPSAVPASLGTIAYVDATSARAPMRRPESLAVRRQLLNVKAPVRRPASVIASDYSGPVVTASTAGASVELSDTLRATQTARSTGSTMIETTVLEAPVAVASSIESQAGTPVEASSVEKTAPSMGRVVVVETAEAVVAAPAADERSELVAASATSAIPSIVTEEVSEPIELAMAIDVGAPSPFSTRAAPQSLPEVKTPEIVDARPAAPMVSEVKTEAAAMIKKETTIIQRAAPAIPAPSAADAGSENKAVEVASLDVAAPVAEPAPAERSSTKNSELSGTSWKLVAINGKEISVTAELHFDGESGFAGGQAPCNSYGGEFANAAPGAFSMDDIFVTEVECGSSDLEASFIDALKQSQGYSLGEDYSTLELRDADGKSLVRFDAF